MKNKFKTLMIIALILMPIQLILAISYDKTHKKEEKSVIVGKIEGLSTKIKEEKKIQKKELKEKLEENKEKTEQTQPVVQKPIIEQKEEPQPTQPISEPIVEPEQTPSGQVSGYYKVTHYGHDCCSTGKTATGYDVRNTIYYNDSQYGQVRIVAMCSQIPLYSIVKIKDYKFGGDIVAIVIDRGVGCSTIDLLVENEATARQYGIQNNTVVEILRNGA